MDRKAKLEAIVIAIKTFNEREGRGAPSQQLIAKIRTDLGASDKTAKDYLQTLQSSGRIKLLGYGFWVVE